MESLVRRHVASSRLAELYAAHIHRAVALSYLLSGDPHLAEDLAQEAFIRTAGRFNHLRNPEHFEAYLRRTIVNLHTSHLRRRRVERRYLQRESRAESPLSGTPDIGTRDELVRALHALPIRQRVAVVLRYCQDLSELQVADALNCSDAAAKNLIARGINSLRRQLGSERT
jgi:RNA polymerase sigma-70 factor (sigma-E family)